jgi:hypothetical protein
MRLRLGLLIAAVFTTLFSPVAPQAIAASGYASAPNSVTASAIAGGVRVGWSAPTDLDSGVTGYRVEYSTSGTSGTWNLYATVNSSTFTSDILGLSQTATYVRVAATTNSGNNVGTYGYPWNKIYGTTSTNRNLSGQIDYESGYGLGGSDPYTTQSAAAFTRIKYRMDTTISGVSRFAETDFYEWVRSGTTQATTATQWDATVSTIMIPTPATYTYNIQANVTDLNVYSNHPSVSNTNGSSGVAGRLEIWPWNYGPELSTLSDGTTAGSGSTYDYNDTPAGASGYGSFQVHDLSTYKPVFAWNNQANGANPEIGYGKNTGTHPDWTFCAQGGGMGTCTTPSYFRLQIFVNIPVTPLADATPPTVSRGDAKTLIRSGDTISVRSTEIGTVYLIRNTVTVTNLASITAAAANVKNSVSISAINTSTTLTTSGLLDGTYNLYAVDSANNISTALNATVAVDTTPPVATNFSVNSSGDAVLMTIGETATLAVFDGGAYSISDSGSALSVTSASISGLVITLNLSRAIPAGATVTFAYSTAGISTASRWVDAAGNQLNNVTSRTITNNSGVQISVGLTVADSISRNTPITVSASAAVAGRVTFTIAGKRIPGCLNKVASGSTPITVTCTFKPALSGWQRITATLVPTIGAYPTTLTSVDRFISKRTNLR